ncbi:MAG: hypothetical protein CVU99_06885 [Firmicutes bacterium HGW-Firmicutes-4]|jgi:HJR/Mrr/RecB family endonuclease|nr:MAG: hypothetical protein CVU99_06885 [Firmicutes bacterium HGW-Firmicutes-4]
MMNIWLHRISHCYEVAKPLLEQNYLTIGFADYVKDFLKYGGDNKAVWDHFEADIESIYGASFRPRHNLKKFLFEFEVGDQVVIPLWGAFSVYKIIETAKPLTSLPKEVLEKMNSKVFIDKDGLLSVRRNGTDIAEIDLGFFIQVEPVKLNIPRDGYCSSALISRMKIRQATANISDLVLVVNDAVNRAHTNNRIDFHYEASKAMRKVLINTILDKLNDRDFEKLVQWYMKKIGATETTIPAKNEPGKYDGADADVIANFELLKCIIYVQVKHHVGFTSDWAVNQIARYKKQKDVPDDAYTRMTWVVTSAEFTDETKNKAQLDGVRLIDQHEFANMLIDAGLDGINNAFS